MFFGALGFSFLLTWGWSLRNLPSDESMDVDEDGVPSSLCTVVYLDKAYFLERIDELPSGAGNGIIVQCDDLMLDAGAKARVKW